jgi:sortase A
MKRKVLSILFIGAGIWLLVFPKLSDYYQDQQQLRLVEEWQEAFQTVERVEEEEASLEVFQTAQLEDTLEAKSETPSLQASPQREPVKLTENMEGILYIDKIDLKLPILRGATEKNMKVAAASIEKTGEPGEIGNFAVAGHRSLTYGRHFNRLDELEAGDAMDVDVGTETYEYVVTEKLYVEPSEVWVLEATGTDREITLVTCHPIDTGTHRLIIKGKMLES